MYKIDKKVCTGCEQCVDVCPCGCIHLDEKENVCVIDHASCAECGTCEAECPFSAISEVDDAEEDDQQK